MGEAAREHLETLQGEVVGRLKALGVAVPINIYKLPLESLVKEHARLFPKGFRTSLERDSVAAACDVGAPLQDDRPRSVDRSTGRSPPAAGQDCGKQKLDSVAAASAAQDAVGGRPPSALRAATTAGSRVVAELLASRMGFRLHA